MIRGVYIYSFGFQWKWLDGVFVSSRLTMTPHRACFEYRWYASSYELQPASPCDSYIRLQLTGEHPPSRLACKHARRLGFI